MREIADRFQALTDVLAQREPAGVTPLLEARIIDANTLTLRRQEREAGVAVKTTVAELNQLRGRPVTAALEISGGQPGFVQASLQTLLVARANTPSTFAFARPSWRSKVSKFRCRKTNVIRNCRWTLLFPGKCGGQGTAGRHCHFSTAARLGSQHRKHSNGQSA